MQKYHKTLHPLALFVVCKWNTEKKFDGNGKIFGIFQTEDEEQEEQEEDEEQE